MFRTILAELSDTLVQWSSGLILAHQRISSGEADPAWLVDIKGDVFGVLSRVKGRSEVDTVGLLIRVGWFADNVSCRGDEASRMKFHGLNQWNG